MVSAADTAPKSTPTGLARHLLEAHPKTTTTDEPHDDAGYDHKYDADSDADSDAEAGLVGAEPCGGGVPGRLRRIPHPGSHQDL